jgi:hypothetical protein
LYGVLGGSFSKEF